MPNRYFDSTELVDMHGRTLEVGDICMLWYTAQMAMVRIERLRDTGEDRFYKRGLVNFSFIYCTPGGKYNVHGGSRVAYEESRILKLNGMDAELAKVPRKGSWHGE